MSETDPARITGLLQQWQQGSTDALEELWPLVMLPLSRISRKILREFVRGPNKSSTLCTTDLVHQAFPKLARYSSNQDRPWSNRVEFFALAKKVMLCVLLDYHRYSERHGNKSGEPLPNDDVWAPEAETLSMNTLIDLDQNMDLLRTVDPKGYRIIRLRFFEDYNVVDIIKETGWTEYKVYLHLKGALGFLYAKMKG